jgi:hypothetical protein
MWQELTKSLGQKFKVPAYEWIKWMLMHEMKGKW